MTTPKRASVAFVTLGCPKNEVDTDRMRAAVRSSLAFEVAEDTEPADIVVVNTCSFIQEATEASIEAVLEISASTHGTHADQRVIVAGCMPSRYGADLATAMPEVAAFVPVTEEGALLEALERLTGVEAGTREEKAATRTLEGSSAYLQISDGCHRKCAYCTIPAIRGPYRSRSLPDVVAEAHELVGLGAKEIVLIGQDITAWGRDLEGPETLADVVRAIAAVEGVHWLRLMYAQPDGVTDELLAAMAENDNVVRYLDMPLQHASEPVLRSMHRRGSGESYLELIARVRTAMPDAILRTTLIAGFPGETRKDALALQRFLEQARFDYVGVFPYSAEEGTEAATMAAQIPLRTKRARAQRLRDIADTIGFEKAAEHIGHTVEVLVEGVDPDEGMIVGRWRGQAPEIDGLVLLDGGEPGEIVPVRIIDSLGYDLEGEVIR